MSNHQTSNDRPLPKSPKGDDANRDSVLSLISALYDQTQALQQENTNILKELMTIKELLATKTFIRSKWAVLRYNERLSEITVSGHYLMSFENTIENELLRLMFDLKSGKPLDDRFEYGQFLEDLKDTSLKQFATVRGIYKTAMHLRDRFRKELAVDVLCVKSSEFYWYEVN